MITSGLLSREHAGVYVVLGQADQPLGRETAALLACGDRAVLSHRSAAALWGLIPASDGPVVVRVVGVDTGRRRPGIEVHRTEQLLTRDVRIHRQLPVTSPAQALVDYAEDAAPRAVERALDEGLVVRQIVRMRELQDVVRRTPARGGARIVSQLLADRGPGIITQSEAERRFLELVRRANLPEPRTQVSIAGFTADFFWPEHRVAFEVDGFRYHKSRSAFNRDRAKDAAFKAALVDLNRVSADQVFKSPMIVVAYVVRGADARTGDRAIREPFAEAYASTASSARPSSG